MSTQVMLGPVVDIELVHPPDRTPPGVVFGIKHLLTVPNSPEVREALEDEANSHSHQIIKMTSEKDGKHELEVIDSTIELTSQYFITEKLEGRSLCKIASAWLPWIGSTHECTHSSLKDVVVTQKVGRCPHKKNSLYVWCVCPGSEKLFEKEMRSTLHERTGAFTKVYINKSEEHVYNIKLRLSEREEARWEPLHQISHVEMCRFNGVKLFDGGTLKSDFGCSCSEATNHCMDDDLIFFEVEEELEGQLVSGSKRSHDALLSCNQDVLVPGSSLQPVSSQQQVIDMFG